MVNTKELIRAGCKYLGTPYDKLDCQAFIERCLKDIGVRKDLSGSNAWFREILQNGWIGSPEECIEKYGRIPPGAFLFILADVSDSTPAKYRDDGIGDATHIGIYTGETGNTMVAISGDPKNFKYNFGDGAIHSSHSKGGVCTSRFAGKSIKGGWNRVGLWNRLDYGGDTVQVTYKAKVIGGGLNIRAEPDKSSERLGQIPNGTVITVTEDLAGWSKIEYGDIIGYVVSSYLQEVREEIEMVTVSKKELQSMYDMLGDWLGLRG